MPRRVTIEDLRRKKELGEPIVMVTAYDTPTARIVDRAGVDLILCGDSLGMVVLGHDSTLKVTMEDMVRHTAAAARARPRALLAADMPFLSFQVSPESAVENAGRLVREGGADLVKLEGGRTMVPAVLAITRASIPVIGHLGLTPQSILHFGGYRVQGRGEGAEASLLADARALADAGAVLIVLEGIPQTLGRKITAAVPVPTVGIGAGPGTDGQVLVLHDLAGLTEGPLPRFVKRYGEIGTALEAAVASFAGEVRKGEYPAPAHCYD
jgi:3-methyl-2-oxobutanoate hydroxymethyltransferase